MFRFKLKLYLTGAGLSLALAAQGTAWGQEIAYEVRSCGVNEASVIDKAGDMTPSVAGSCYKATGTYTLKK